jgi:hypothetical protein
MKVTTTFWSEEIHEFNELFYINGHTDEIMFQTDLSDSYKTYCFFKNISKFVKSNNVRKTIGDLNKNYFQFAIKKDNKLVHIKWFDLIVGKNKISHDIAFETTLIKKNDVVIPFGSFPMWYSNKVYAKYREFNIKSRAFKYIANQVNYLAVNDEASRLLI